MVLTVDWARRQSENTQLGELDLKQILTHVRWLFSRDSEVHYDSDFNPNDECSISSISFFVPEGRSVYDGLLVKP